MGLAALALLAGEARVTDCIWTNSSAGTDWAAAANWSNGVPDTASERAVFNGSGTNDVTVTNAPWFGGILVDSGQTGGLTIDFSAGGLSFFRVYPGTVIQINAGAGAFTLNKPSTASAIIYATLTQTTPIGSPFVWKIEPVEHI